APPVSKEAICKFTPDPSFCNYVLPNQTSNVYEFWRYAAQKSLSQSRKFLNLVDKYLKLHSTLSKTAVLALQDCQFLAGLNIDFLASSLETLNATKYQTLSSLKTDDVQTLLSAILTNQQTCLDGIQATASSWSVKRGLSVPLSNDTSLYSVSLALFTKAWVPKTKKKGRKLLDQTDQQIIDTNDVLVRDNVTVSQDGSGNFTTISDAVEAAPNNSAPSKGYFLIYIKAGVYEEYVTIDKKKKYLMMIGDGINQTVVTGNRSVKGGNWTTFRSATFAVVGQGFVAVNMTFRNTAGAENSQAVAVRNGADLSTFYRCSFEGYQDTLYTHNQRQFYRECDIYGTVDFIFGNAAVVFQNCNMYPRLPMSKQFNAITAQGRTDPNQNTGISIHNCTIRAADDLASSDGSTKTYLGRPWKAYSRTVYMQSFVDSLIDEEGWHEWDGNFALKTLDYAEYDNTGPGQRLQAEFHGMVTIEPGNQNLHNSLFRPLATHSPRSKRAFHKCPPNFVNLTNQQTCLDGIQSTASAWSLKTGLSAPNDTKFYSVSLALFTKGWVPKKKKSATWKPTRKQRGFKNGRLPLKMTSRTRAVYEGVTKRKMLQTETEDDGVLVSEVVTVSQNGTGNFSTINDAIAAAPNNSASTNGYFLIYVTAGVYEEYVSIAKNKRYLMMVGDGINQTILTGNRSVVDGWTTFNSATFAVTAPGFVAVNMTFRNTAGAIKHQAVAVRNGADLSTFYSCSFEAYQDTLYTHSLRQFYRECDIYGTVDFIFGNAAVVFQNCNLYPRLPMSGQFNAITAQGRTDPNQNTGTSIHNCTIRAADDLASSNSSTKTYLGRPWKEYSRTVYMQSYIDSAVDPAGWRAWDGEFALSTLYYASITTPVPDQTLQTELHGQVTM
ncbi:Plant invertase/pectin methylesterase inhibitor superfamily, partial [Prunus dulcis]